MRQPTRVAVAVIVATGFAASMATAQAWPTDVDPAQPAARPQSATLTCRPAGGTHPHPDAACDALETAAASGSDPFAPVPNDQACTFIYGGPETATVTGTWRGEDVDAAFSRTDGCQIARWDRLEPVLAPGDR